MGCGVEDSPFSAKPIFNKTVNASKDKKGFVYGVQSDSRTEEKMPKCPQSSCAVGRDSSFGPNNNILREGSFNGRHSVAPTHTLNMQLKSRKNLKASDSKEILKPRMTSKEDEPNRMSLGPSIKEKGPKVVKYNDPSVKIGTGKHGPVDLIIYDNELRALKRIPRSSVLNEKRIELVLNEKRILKLL